jgi:hypothetical protein
MLTAVSTNAAKLTAWAFCSCVHLPGSGNAARIASISLMSLSALIAYILPTKNDKT